MAHYLQEETHQTNLPIPTMLTGFYVQELRLPNGTLFVHSLLRRSWEDE